MAKSKRVMLIVGCVLLGAFVVLKCLSFTGSVPVRPNDISALPACPASPNCICSQDSDRDHLVAPIQFSGDSRIAWKKLKETIAEHGGRLAEERKDDYARFEFRSRFIRYVDDVEILLNPEREQIEIRSASRSGYSDLGVNRKRVEAIRARFSAE